MYMRAVIFRIVYVGVLSFAILAGMAFRQSTVHAASAEAIAAKPDPIAQALVPPIVTLPLIEVRAQMPRAQRTTRSPSAAAVIIELRAEPKTAAAPQPGSASSMPRLRLDMPYYSLGRFLPNVGKE